MPDIATQIFAQSVYTKYIGLLNQVEQFIKTNAIIAAGLTKTIRRFERTENLPAQLAHLGGHADSIIPHFDRPITEPNSFVAKLKELSEQYISTNGFTEEEFLAIVGVKSMDELNALRNVPSAYVKFMGSSIINGVFETIYESYPFSEVRVGLYLAALEINKQFASLDLVLAHLQHFSDRLTQEFNMDVDGKTQQKLRNLSETLHIKNNGEYDFDKTTNILFKNLEQEDINNIILSKRYCMFILKATQNEIEVSCPGLRYFICFLENSRHTFEE